MVDRSYLGTMFLDAHNLQKATKRDIVTTVATSSRLGIALF